MRVSNLLKSAALGLFIGLVGACSNEEFQNGLPDQTVNLKDGETLVKMKIAGIGGTVETRANENITLPGEVEIKKLDLYCFVNLTAANTSATTTTEAEYSLERIYTYKALGSANDLALTPVGDGYQASFGVPKDAYNRIFVLIANDIDSRNSAPAAVSVATAGSGNDRSSATALGGASGLTTLKILETALSANGTNISTPLPMTAFAGRNEYGSDGVLKLNKVYTKADFEEGKAVNAELKRAMTRIDIKNPAATNFTITKVKLTGAENSNLFFAADNSDVPDATSSGDYDIVALADKTIAMNAEMLPAALYAYPVKKSNNGTPKVTITGSVGGSGDIEVVAEFGDGMTTTTKGMMPNTRYIVNLYNSAGNITADITIADWIPGETIDTEDAATKLNASATLAAVSGKATLTERELFITFYVAGPSATGCNENESFATILGATGDSDKKPIGIILPPDCDWITVEKDDTKTNQAAYNLKLAKHNATPRPRTATLSLVTYNITTKKQEVSEYIVHQDYRNITTATGNFPKVSDMLSCWEAVSFDDANNICNLPPVAIDKALLIGKGDNTVDVLIPENCTWLTKNEVTIGGEKKMFLGIEDNIGKEERRATIKMRRWDNSGGTIVEKEYTIIQTGVLDKSMLSDGAVIVPTEGMVEAKLIKIDGKTIILTGQNAYNAANVSETPFSIKANSKDDKPLPVVVTSGADWFTAYNTAVMVLYPGNATYATFYTRVIYPLSSDASTPARETTFTVTTYANGAPVVETYRLIQMAYGGTIE